MHHLPNDQNSEKQMKLNISQRRQLPKLEQVSK